MGIQWELKGKSSTNYYDASVYLVDKGKKTDISIKNEFWKKMGCPDRVSCGVDKDAGRIYFREDKKGYAVMRSGSKMRVYFHMAAPHKDFVGDYDVYFDPELKMYYISRRDKE
jgi:hypothetical protein